MIVQPISLWRVLNPWRELGILWGVIRYDVSTTIVSGTLFTLASWHTTIGQQQPLFPLLAYTLVYFLLYGLCVTMSNQIAGVEEDRLNKPERPLPSGQISMVGAWVRWIAAMVLFSVVGWSLGVGEWTLLWQVVLVIHNFGHGARHYVAKNTAMCVGLIAQIAAAWQLVQPITPTAWAWILVPGLIMLTNVSLQDMRDVVGDRANGRRTFPLVFGYTASRWFLAVAFALLPVIVYAVLLAPFGTAWPALLCNAIMTGLCLWIVRRLVIYDAPADHHRTYMLFTYWYCALLASAIILLD